MEENNNGFAIVDIAIMLDYFDGEKRCNATSCYMWMDSQSWEDIIEYCKNFVKQQDEKINNSQQEFKQESFVCGGRILYDHKKI